jgi:hypothetical protein
VDSRCGRVLRAHFAAKLGMIPKRWPFLQLA